MRECNNCSEEKEEGEEIGPNLFYCSDCLGPVSDGALREKEVEKGERFGYRK